MDLKVSVLLFEEMELLSSLERCHCPGVSSWNSESGRESSGFGVDL